MAREVEPREPEAAHGRSRLHELDGLRAIAIALVVAHHSITGAVSEGLDSVGLGLVGELVFFATGSGVELFFVLSGVLLLRPYLRGERHFRPVVYLRRRVERLWPPYALALVLAGLVIALGRLHPTWYSREVLPSFSGSGWLAQVGILNLGWRSYSGAWWSLNLEVFFYLLVPLLVVGLVAPRRRTDRLAVLVVLSIVASLAVSSLSDFADAYLRAGTATAGSDAPDPWQVVQAFLIYAPCFALGAAIARYRCSVRTGLVLAAYGTAHCLLALALPALNVHLGFAFLYAGIVVLAMEGSGRLRARLSAPLLVWLGERSYSLFLVHFPAFYLANYLVSLVLPGRGVVYFALTRLIGLPMALLAAMALFSLVEARFARGLATADRFWPRRLS